MIIENPSEIKKENLRIFVKGYDWKNQRSANFHLIPKEIDELVLTQPSCISTEIYKVKPDLNILFFSKGNLMASVMPVDNLPKIMKNEELFNKLSKHKRKKLMWTFCKAVCSGRIKTLSRLNEVRNNLVVKETLERMRVLDRKLIRAKTREELMGIEGNITKYFYSGLSELSEIWDSEFNNRNRNNKDIINSLMNFGHTVLRNKIKYSLILNGLNPYHSFLHNNQRGQEYLTFDFAEFWIAYVDKLIFYSLEKGVIKKTDMNQAGLLNENAKKEIIRLINERINNETIDFKVKEFLGYLKGESRLSWKTYNKRDGRRYN